MAERLFSYGDVPILLDSSHNMLCETPRITGLQPLDDGQPVATVHHRVADSFALNREGEHSISIEGPLELTNAIFYLGELAAESYRQSELGGALVHAAAIYKDGGSHIIFGEKGAGKTTLAIRSCVEDGYKLVGNDQVIIAPCEDGSLSATDGSKYLAVRHSAASADLWLGKHIDASWDEGEPHWDSKKEFTPQQLGIQVHAGQGKISSVFKLCIDRTQTLDIIEPKPASDIGSMLFFVEKFSRHIRGTATPILTDRGTLLGQSPNMDSAKSEANRIALIRGLFLDIGVWNIYAKDSKRALEGMQQVSYGI